MLISKSGLKVGTYNKWQGLRLLTELERAGKLGKVQVERQRFVTFGELERIIHSPGRRHPVLARVTPLRGDFELCEWILHDSKKFPPLGMIGEEELKGRKKSIRQSLGMLGNNGGLLLLQLPEGKYAGYVNLDILHADREFFISFTGCPMPTHQAVTMLDTSDYMEHGSVGGDERSGILKKAGAPDAVPPQFRDIVEIVPDLMREFGSLVSKIRFSIYQGISNAFAFDWRLADR